jgi:hypothetical protein
MLVAAMTTRYQHVALWVTGIYSEKRLARTYGSPKIGLCRLGAARWK